MRIFVILIGITFLIIALYLGVKKLLTLFFLGAYNKESISEDRIEYIIDEEKIKEEDLESFQRSFNEKVSKKPTIQKRTNTRKKK